jgi:photosystem II stability/assembly factor-like uncharacterized protein
LLFYPELSVIFVGVYYLILGICMKKASLLLVILMFSLQAVFSQSWRRVGNWGNDFYDIQWVTNEVGYIAGENILLKSIDGGLSWIERQSPTREKVTSLAFFDDQSGMLMAENSLYRTADGGETWTTITLNSNESLTDFQYLDENNLVLAGKKGGLYLSMDAGLSWQKQDPVTTADLNGLFFFDNDHGFVVSSLSAESDKNQLDGGRNWESNPNGFRGGSLNAVYFHR